MSRSGVEAVQSACTRATGWANSDLSDRRNPLVRAATEFLAPTRGLTRREVEVLRLAARGLATREIAEQLYISPKTADHHIQHIYTKIGVSTRAAAALWAMENAVVS